MTLEVVDTNASVSDAMAAVEISDNTEDTDAAKRAAEKKAEENRKKRERQKKKKAAEKAAACLLPLGRPAADTMNRWSTESCQAVVRSGVRAEGGARPRRLRSTA